MTVSRARLPVCLSSTSIGIGANVSSSKWKPESAKSGTGPKSKLSRRGTIVLSTTASPGRRYKFGDVHISNPEGVVDKRLIKDQVTSVIEKGEWFTPEMLEEAQARVFQMGVFSAVKVTRAALDQQTGEVPVAVDVREAPFQTWRAGGGLGGDQLRNELRGTVMYENRNFLGGTRPSCLAACDANGDGQVSGVVTDAVYLLTFNFLGGSAPVAPYPECGPGTEADKGLGCETRPQVCP